MPANFVTTNGQRVSVNCNPAAYTYAIVDDQSGVVRLKFPDVPEFEVLKDALNLVLPDPAEFEQHDTLCVNPLGKEERLEDYLGRVISALKGDNREGADATFHTLFMEGDIWKVVDERWDDPLDDDVDPHSYHHFHGLKKGDEIVISKTLWDDMGYSAWTAATHPNFDPAYVEYCRTGLYPSKSNPPRFVDDGLQLCILAPHNAILGHVVFMGNPTFKGQRVFGCEITGEIPLTVGKKLVIPKRVLQMTAAGVRSATSA